MSDLLQVFEANRVLIRRIIARYGVRAADVEDLAQETFLRAFAAQTDTVLRNPKAFLVRVARNLAISEVKKKVNSASVSIEDFDELDVLRQYGTESPEQRLLDKQRLVVMVKAVASLPPLLRETFIMRKVDHLKFRQIATRLNVSVSTVEKRAASALLAVEAHLRATGFDPLEIGNRASKRPARQPETKL